jgi:hypothetical protein
MRSSENERIFLLLRARLFNPVTEVRILSRKKNFSTLIFRTRDVQCWAESVGCRIKALGFEVYTKYIGYIGYIGFRVEGSGVEGLGFRV